MSSGERRSLIALLGFLTFNAVYSGIVTAPVLTQIADEFGITTGTAGLVVAAYGAPGILDRPRNRARRLNGRRIVA